MSDAERIYSLYVQANPVPDADLLPLALDEAELLITERSRDMATQQLTEAQGVRQRAPWRAAAIAFAAVIVFGAIVGAGFLLGNDTVEVMQTDELSFATQVVDSWIVAWQSDDGAAVAALFTEDGMFVDLGRGTLRGRDLIESDVAFRGPGTTNGQRTGELALTEEGTYVFPAQFDFDGEGPWVGEMEITLEGDLISRLEWLHWTLQD